MKVISKIIEIGLVAVIRAESADDARRIADACAQGGVTALEITFTVPSAAGAIAALVKAYPGDSIAIGAGTVLDADTAREAILAGAQFVVSPALIPEAARFCNQHEVPYIPGAGTVREIIEGTQAGAEIVKVFPGETLGPAFVKAVKAVLPNVSLMPTGGVSIENAGEWIRAGAVAIGVGSNLTKAPNVIETAKRFIEEIRRARA